MGDLNTRDDHAQTYKHPLTFIYLKFLHEIALLYQLYHHGHMRKKISHIYKKYRIK